MKNIRKEKGITLIALIITIVVLVILASIGISSVQEDGIIGHAKNEKEKYNQAQSEYNQMIGVLNNELNNELNGGNTGSTGGNGTTTGGNTSTGDNTTTECTHTWNSGNVTKTATCTTTGIRTYTCTICSETKTETIAASGHSYSSKVTQAQSCTNNEVTTYTCSSCGNSYSETTANRTGHDWSNKDGVCKVCGYNCSHSYSYTVVTPATSTTTGVGKYTCGYCGYYYTVTIPATGGTTTVCTHTTTKTDYISNGYESENHLTRVTCTSCGVTISEKTEGCDFSLYVPDGYGSHYPKCKYCYEFGSSAGDGWAECSDSNVDGWCDTCGGEVHVHNYNQQVATDEYQYTFATCEHKAEYYYSCTCGEAGTETFEYGEYGDHNYDGGYCTECGAYAGHGWS